TRNARNGMLLPNINITNAKYKEDQTLVYKNFTRAYLHHLFRAKELLAYHIATMHNLNYMANLMAEIRVAIVDKKFAKLKERYEKICSPLQT
ncbi:tRNA-guanine transglycosylase, partial [Candidatus Microgenomates bacterium]|nr:tRNA-guanine transglycosylase [Candidatus Microgenomates bacterium]